MEPFAAPFKMKHQLPVDGQGNETGGISCETGQLSDAIFISNGRQESPRNLSAVTNALSCSRSRLPVGPVPLSTAPVPVRKKARSSRAGYYAE
jgi:hypothetical protein